MTTAPPNPRASLLAGLRTGGVRSSSANVPHTAALGGTFNVSRFPSQNHPPVFSEEDSDQLADIPPSNVYANNHYGANRTMPMTAAVDVPSNMFSQQQNHRGMNPNSVPFSPGFPSHMAANQSNQAQAFQMQMMQLELMKIQAMQAQAEVIAQAQRQQSQSQIQNKRLNPGNTPATAGPLSTSFDLRTATLSAQMRRTNQAEQLRAQLGVRGDDHVPMTAALGGKFGSRSVSATAPMSRYDENENAPLPPTPSSTTIISGGTSLGSPLSNNISNNGPSKSDSVSSWRRGGGRTNSVLNGNRSVTSPAVKITPPPVERVSPPPELGTTPTTATTAGLKFRPQPLRFSAAASQPLPVVAIDSSSTDDNDDASSTSSSKSNTNSSPTTPQSSSSNELLPSREEASKKLYEGLGIGRPASAVGNNHPTVTVSEHVDGQQYAYQLPAATLVAQRVVSQPLRQPRGPPSGADELGPKNFATRIRRQAIGGLGMLMDARERREVVEAY